MQVLKKEKLFPFEKSKIKNAIIQANNQIGFPDFDTIDSIVNDIENELEAWNCDIVKVEEIENLVMSYLYREMPDVAREYSSYKIDHERMKTNPTEIEKVLYNTSDIAQENANKDSQRVHIKNAYLAEIPAREEMIKQMPKACLEAHNKCIVYWHDLSYSIRDCHNCELLDLDYLLQHGCEINNVWIEKPKSFRTACTVATQVLQHVTGSTFGGCTINLLHLAKFVDVSRQKIIKKFNQYNISEDIKKQLCEDELNEEIRQGIQTFTYQNQTLCASVGQAVFLTVSVYLNEDSKYTNDLILVFKELLRQRIEGIKDSNGFYVNPNFPKILYFLDEDTMKGGKYYDVTKLCAECSAKRLVPDYMSVKKHMELKGICTPSINKACA